jgi:LysM repeat protein
MVHLDVAGKADFHSGMKRILFSVLFAALTMAPAFGQDATQQQIDKLSGQIQDLQATLGKQDQVLSEIKREISELRDKVNAPQVSESASREDLKNLAEQVQEIDKKRQADRSLILKEIEKLGKISAAPVHKTTTPAPRADDTTAAPAIPQKGYEYEVKSGDSVGAIAKAYRDQGVKVTTAQILKANPKLDPAKLLVGQKIFIPDPNAK